MFVDDKKLQIILILYSQTYGTFLVRKMKKEYVSMFATLLLVFGYYQKKIVLISSKSSIPTSPLDLVRFLFGLLLMANRFQPLTAVQFKTMP